MFFGGMMSGMHYAGWEAASWGDVILGLVINIAGIVLFLLVVIWLVRKFFPQLGNSQITGFASGSLSSARDILPVRYVNGEINRKQYQQMLGDIS